MHIILIGFMGSGKSSVAQQLGPRLTLPILDMDALVLQKTAMQTMHEVFEKGGELLLRETEVAIAQEYALADSHVIATGGGVILNKITLDYLTKSGGKIIFLNASFSTIATRLQGDTTRPLFRRIEEAEKIYCFRQPLYLQYADQVIDVERKSIEEIVGEIQWLVMHSEPSLR